MPDLPKIAFVVAGGTIGMLFSERHGGHVPSLGADEMLKWLPGSLPCELVPIDWARQPSCHYTIGMTTDLVELLRKTVKEGAQGIVVTCGTDLMEEMAYLTDLLWPYPQPVVFTGAVLPPDCPGSDSKLNLIQAFTAAASEKCWGQGVTVCFQDQLFAASEVRKVHSSRRDAFESPGRGPIAEIVQDKVLLYRTPFRSATLGEYVTPAREIELVWAALGCGERLLGCLSRGPDLDGLVLAGTGSGNVPPSWQPHIRSFLKREIPVVITSRCTQGRVGRLYGYEGSAKRLIEMGVLDGGGLRPTQARLKLAVGLGGGLKGKSLQLYLLN